MTSSPIPKAEDPCGVCEETRENHGDKNHEFNINGQLIPKKAGPPPQTQAPQRRSAPGEQLSKDPVARLQIRLIERLVAKELIDSEDMLYIFGGSDASS